MTESNTSLPPAETKTVSTTKTSKNRFSLFLSILTLILLCVSAFYFWQTQTQQAQVIQQLSSSIQDASKKQSSFQNNLQQQLNALNELSDKQQVLLNSLAQESYFHTQKLSDLGARSRNDWLLAEAEYLMHLANQTLTLEQDISSAEAMLTSADKIISEINDPGLIDIRQALASEILSLQQISHLDYEGLYLKLDAMINSLENIKHNALLLKDSSGTIVENTNTTSAPDNTFLALWASIWSDLKQAVVIRRLDKPIEPLLTPEQDYYLKQNLRLMLEQASLALIDKNTVIYQSSIKKAIAWLNKYFIEDEKEIAELKMALSEMLNIKIDQAIPDISNSLRLTKLKIEGFYKQHTINKLSTPDSDIEASKLKTESENKGPAL